MFKVLAATISLIIVLQAKSSSLQHACPESFVGQVSKLVDVDDPSLLFKKVAVTFSHQDGENEFQVALGGRHDFSVGDKFEVQFNGEYLCFLEKI